MIGENAYEALLEFNTGEGVTTHHIRFVSKYRGDAVTDVFRWWANRHEAIPDYFKELYCVKVSSVTLQKIDKTGYLHPDSGMNFFEWKYDWPGTAEQYLESFKVKEKRNWS